MSVTAAPGFDLSLASYPKDLFWVRSFQGREEISGLFHFEIALVVRGEPPVARDLLKDTATLCLRSTEFEEFFHGVLTEFETLRCVDGFCHCRAVLAPRLSLLTRTHGFRVFLEKDARAIVSEILVLNGFSENLDFEFRLKETYVKHGFVLQYDESDFAFISRRLEHEGLFYFFEHQGDKDKLIITDTNMAFESAPWGSVVDYLPPSGLQKTNSSNVLDSFTQHSRSVVGKVKVRDYNYETPDKTIESDASIDKGGQGAVYLYGEHVRTPSHAARLAKVRAEEIGCRRMTFHATGQHVGLRPGRLFSLAGHYREPCNREYLVIEATHRGAQDAYLAAGLKVALGPEEQIGRRSELVCIASDVAFRPARTTPWPRIDGALPARIDAEGTGQYAELDALGRYHVIFHFDASGRDQARASCPLRKVEPYVGADHGMHFPLHKGTEVLVVFKDGHPDRPLIAGALPDPLHPSPVNDTNQTKSLITSSGQNKIHIEDNEGQQRILLSSPTAGSFLRLGAHNDPTPFPGFMLSPSASGGGDNPSPGDATDDAGEAGIYLCTSSALSITAGSENSLVLGESTETTGGLAMINVGGIYLTLLMLESFTVNVGSFRDTQHFTFPIHLTKKSKALHLKNATTRYIILSSELSDLDKEANLMKDDFDGASTEMAAELEKVDLLKTQIKGAVNIVEGATTKTDGMKTTVAQAITTATAADTKAIGQATKAVNKLSKNIAAANKVAGEVVETIENNKKNALAITTMAATTQTL